MCCEGPVEDDILTLEELSEILAEVEDTTPEVIQREASELEIAPLESATRVGD